MEPPALMAAAAVVLLAWEPYDRVAPALALELAALALATSALASAATALVPVVGGWCAAATAANQQAAKTVVKAEMAHTAALHAAHCASIPCHAHPVTIRARQCQTKRNRLIGRETCGCSS